MKFLCQVSVGDLWCGVLAGGGLLFFLTAC